MATKKISDKAIFKIHHIYILVYGFFILNSSGFFWRGWIAFTNNSWPLVALRTNNGVKAWSPQDDVPQWFQPTEPVRSIILTCKRCALSQLLTKVPGRLSTGHPSRQGGGAARKLGAVCPGDWWWVCSLQPGCLFGLSIKINENFTWGWGLLQLLEI